MAGLAATTLLVVDDQPEINKLVARIFEKRGYRVNTASDGAAPRASSAARKMRGSGFLQPASVESTATETDGARPVSSRTAWRLP